MKTDHIKYDYIVYLSCCNHSFYNDQRYIKIVSIPTSDIVLTQLMISLRGIKYNKVYLIRMWLYQILICEHV